MGIFSGAANFKTVDIPADARADIAALLPSRPVDYKLSSYSRAVSLLSARLPADERCLEIVPGSYITPNGSWFGVVALTGSRLVICMVENSNSGKSDVLRAAPRERVRMKAGKHPQDGKWYLTIGLEEEEYVVVVGGGKARKSSDLDGAVTLIRQSVGSPDPFAL